MAFLWAVTGVAAFGADGAQSGAVVTHGRADISSAGPNTTVTTGGERTIIQWDRFGVSGGTTTHFAQPEANAATLNRVVGDVPTRIDGTLTSNGAVYVINQRGVTVGPDGRVAADGGFVASTLNLADDDFKRGVHRFKGDGAHGAVAQYGLVESAAGDVFLLGSRVVNDGAVRAPEGTVGLGAGAEIVLEPVGSSAGSGGRMRIVAGNAGYLDGTGVEQGASGSITAATAELRAHGDPYRLAVNNQGVIVARGTARTPDGRVFLTATRRADDGRDVAAGTLMHGGSIRAENADGTGGYAVVTAHDVTLASGAAVDVSATAGRGGTAYIGGAWQGGAADGTNYAPPTAATLTVESGAVITADGAGVGDGGLAVLWADRATSFWGQVAARAGASGGDGGAVEVSGREALTFGGRVDTTAASGSTGLVYLDPTNFTISAAASSANNMNVTDLVNLIGTNNVVIATSAAGTQSGDITVSADVSYDSPHHLLLLAHNNIAVNRKLENGYTAAAGNTDASITLVAGWDGTTTVYDGANVFNANVPTSATALLDASTNWFGHNGAGSVTIGGNATSVGSRSGRTTVLAHDITLARYGRIGYADTGGAFAGGIHVAARGNVVGSGSSIGHTATGVTATRPDGTDVFVADGVFTGNIAVLAGKDVDWSGRRIGHGLDMSDDDRVFTDMTSTMTFDGAEIFVQAGGGIELESISVIISHQWRAQIGHGLGVIFRGAATTDEKLLTLNGSARDAHITVEALTGDIALSGSGTTGHSDAGIYAAIGHGNYIYSPAAADATGITGVFSAVNADIAVTAAQGDIALQGGVGWGADARIGHGFLGDSSAIRITHTLVADDADITVTAAEAVTLANNGDRIGQIGHYGANGHDWTLSADRANIEVSGASLTVTGSAVGHGGLGNGSVVARDADITIRVAGSDDIVVARNNHPGRIGHWMYANELKDHAATMDVSRSDISIVNVGGGVYVNASNYSSLIGNTTSAQIGHGGSFGRGSVDFQLIADGAAIAIEAAGDIRLNGARHYNAASIGHGFIARANDGFDVRVQAADAPVTVTSTAGAVTVEGAAWIGHGGNGAGAGAGNLLRYVLTADRSDITVRAVGDVQVTGTSTGDQGTQIGHRVWVSGSILSSSEYQNTISALNAGITVESGGDIVVEAGEDYAQIGHGGRRYGSTGNSSLVEIRIDADGAAIEAHAAGDISITGGSSDFAYGKIGHGGASHYGVTGVTLNASDAPISVWADKGIDVMAGTSTWGAYGQIGHGYSGDVINSGYTTADVRTIANNSRIIVRSEAEGVAVIGSTNLVRNSHATIGHGGYWRINGRAAATLVTDSDITMVINGSLTMSDAGIGHIYSTDAVRDHDFIQMYIYAADDIHLSGASSFASNAPGAAIDITTGGRFINESTLGVNTIRLFGEGKAAITVAQAVDGDLGSLRVRETHFPVHETSILFLEGRPSTFAFVPGRDSNTGYLIGTAQRAIITITVGNESSIYGSTPVVVGRYAVDVDASGLEDGDTVEDVLASIRTDGLAFSTDATDASTVDGTYYIRADGLVSDLGYKFVYVDGTLEITPQAIVVTADHATSVYGDAPSAILGWSVTTGYLVGADWPTGELAVNVTAASDAGAYNILQGSLDFGPNYTVAFNGEAQYTVTPRPIRVGSADGGTVVYGDALADVPWTLTGGNLVNGDTASGSLFYDIQAGVGTHRLSAGTLQFGGRGGQNYAVDWSGLGDVTVTPRPVEIAVSDDTRVYGDTGTAGWRTVNGTSLAAWDVGADFGSPETFDALTDVGTYAVGAGSLDFGANYVVTAFTPGTLTITPRLVTVAADPVRRYEGESNPDFTWRVTAGSAAAGESFDVALSTTADESSAPGQYDIDGTVRVVNAAAEDRTANYAVTYVGEDRLTILMTPVTPDVPDVPAIPEVLIPSTPSVAPTTPGIPSLDAVTWDDDLEDRYPTVPPPAAKPAPMPTPTDYGYPAPAAPAVAPAPVPAPAPAAVAPAPAVDDGRELAVGEEMLRAVTLALEDDRSWLTRLQTMKDAGQLDPTHEYALESVLEVQSVFLTLRNLTERFNAAYAALSPADRAVAMPFRGREMAASLAASRSAMGMIRRMAAQLRWRDDVGPDTDEMSLRTVLSLSHAIDLAADRLWLGAARLAVVTHHVVTRAAMPPAARAAAPWTADGWSATLDEAERRMAEHVAENRRRRDGMRTHLTERRYRQALGMDQNQNQN